MRLIILYITLFVGGFLLVLDGYLLHCHNHEHVGIFSFLIGCVAIAWGFFSFASGRWLSTSEL